MRAYRISDQAKMVMLSVAIVAAGFLAYAYNRISYTPPKTLVYTVQVGFPSAADVLRVQQGRHSGTTYQTTRPEYPRAGQGSMDALAIASISQDVVNLGKGYNFMPNPLEVQDIRELNELPRARDVPDSSGRKIREGSYVIEGTSNPGDYSLAMSFTRGEDIVRKKET
ncbi:MAG: hypothetical protein HYT72_03825 [Candidatus Aenigmarchaeota archaeon]|nr:hypothetical protein [Candidatus Aenigmarchaeota archaeon]